MSSSYFGQFNLCVLLYHPIYWEYIVTNIVKVTFHSLEKKFILQVSQIICQVLIYALNQCSVNIWVHTRPTLNQYLHRHLIDSLSVGQVLNDIYVSVNTQWHVWKNYRYLTFDQLSTEKSIECQPSVDQILIIDQESIWGIDLGCQSALDCGCLSYR